MKVLAVDDSKSILKLIVKILAAHKYTAETAENGAEAIHKYVQFKPDIVTLDLAMPVMDGYETLKKILALDKDANIVMLTASEHQEILERCLQKGAIGYIIKPFTAKELVTTINNVWHAGADKNVAVLFSLARGSIETSIKKMVGYSASDVSVTLSGVQVIRQSSSTQILTPTLDVAQIRIVPNLVEDLSVEVPKDAIGYITEFGGQQQGAVISFIPARDLAVLFANDEDGRENDETNEQILEFFNIFNIKVISELANATHLVLTPKPVQLYDSSKAEKHSLGNELTKAIFEIMIGQKNVAIEVQLWFNAGQIFRGRF